MLPGQSESGGVTLNDTFDVSVRDLCAPVQRIQKMSSVITLLIHDCSVIVIIVMESELPDVDSCNIRATVPNNAFTNSACINNLQFKLEGLIQCRF